MNRIVRKDTNLILARNTWSETESKLLASFITKLEPVIKLETNQQLKDLLPIEENYENIEFPEITITIQELEKLWGCKLNTTQIDKICIDLKTKIYILKGEDKKGKYKNYVSLFDCIKYHYEKKEITYIFHKDMKPYLLEFTRQFVKYDIINILQFKSKYSIQFYERFKLQTQFKKETLITETIKLQELREWLGLNANKYNNLKKDKYTRMYDLKINILEKVKADLKKYSDVYMNYEFKKVYKTVTDIKFIFTKNIKSVIKKEFLFSSEELSNIYNFLIGYRYVNQDGDLCIVKQIVEVLHNNNYIKAIVHNDFAGNMEVRLAKDWIEKIRQNIK
jgi:plasmid replication initiation protein